MRCMIALIMINCATGLSAQTAPHDQPDKDGDTDKKQSDSVLVLSPLEISARSNVGYGAKRSTTIISPQ